MLASLLLASSGLVIFLLGTVHLLYTFRGAKLAPRDPALQRAMEASSLQITYETTMWKAWVGFNGSHSLGAMLFGLVYVYLALAHSAFLFSSVFLLAVGFSMLCALLVLGKLYWFSIPFRGISLALLLYVGALIARVA